MGNDNPNFNLERKGRYTIAEVTVNLSDGLGLRESGRICSEASRRNLSTVLIKGDTEISLNRGVVGVPYHINKGDVVKIRVKSVGKEAENYITSLCEYLSSQGETENHASPGGSGMMLTEL